jgi:hypothetical protein
MKNSPLTTILLGVLTVSALASVVLCWLCITNTRQKNSLQSQANIIPFGGDSAFHYFAGTATNPVLSASRFVQGSATGLGDVALRMKLNVHNSDRSSVALLARKKSSVFALLRRNATLPMNAMTRTVTSAVARRSRRPPAPGDPWNERPPPIACHRPTIRGFHSERTVRRVRRVAGRRCRCYGAAGRGWVGWGPSTPVAEGLRTRRRSGPRVS